MVYRVIPLEGFLNLEMIQAARFINGNIIKDLRKSLQEEEILDYSSANNLKRKVGILIKRFSVLDDLLVKELVEADIATTEFITFYSIVKNERIIFDFLNEIIFSNYIKLKKYITKDEIDNFIIEKARQVEEVNKWTDATKQRMKNKIIEFSMKGGYLKKGDSDYTIVFPSVSKKTVEHIKKIESDELSAILFLEKGN
ncbi:MAG: DUF1819 family protein [Fusobacteriaceae bacterium]|nr:DUF1819 family protein [Fusobacteriaceae bacterium]